MEAKNKEFKFFIGILSLTLIVIFIFNLIWSFIRDKDYTIYKESLNKIYLVDSKINKSLTSKLTKEDFINTLKRLVKQEIIFREINFEKINCSWKYFNDVNSITMKDNLENCKFIEFLVEKKWINNKDKNWQLLNFEKDEKMNRFEVYKFLTILFLNQYPSDFQIYDWFTGYLDLTKEQESYVYTLEKYKISTRKYNNFYPKEKIEIWEFYKILNNFVSLSTIDINVLNNYKNNK